MKKILLSVCLLLTTLSCSLLFQKEHVSRGKLSEAMEKSSDSHRGERKVADSKQKRDDSPGFRGMQHTTENTQSGLAPNQKTISNALSTSHTEENYIGIRIHSGLKYFSDYSNITGGSVLMGTHYGSRRRISLYGGAAGLSINPKSDLLGSIKNLFQLHLGIEHRSYLTHDKTILGLYIPIEFEFKALFWKYNNPIITDVFDDDRNFLRTETITHDGLNGFSLGSGLGLSLVQTKTIQLSGTAITGGTLYFFDTHEGFENDVFAGDFFLKVCADLVIGF